MQSQCNPSVFLSNKLNPILVESGIIIEMRYVIAIIYHSRVICTHSY